MCIRTPNWEINTVARTQVMLCCGRLDLNSRPIVHAPHFALRSGAVRPMCNIHFGHIQPTTTHNTHIFDMGRRASPRARSRAAHKRGGGLRTTHTHARVRSHSALR